MRANIRTRVVALREKDGRLFFNLPSGVKTLLALYENRPPYHKLKEFPIKLPFELPECERGKPILLLVLRENYPSDLKTILVEYEGND